MFVDSAKIKIISGKGGNGAVSFRREPFVPNGGPDGGNGGRGGDIIFQADGGLRTLMDFRYQKKYVAESGSNGMKKKKYGKDGEDLIIKVPVGTLVIDQETGKVMKDLTEDGESFVAAKGGKGGKGNFCFRNSIRQAPNFAEAGDPGVERMVRLELKLIADVGLVGFPNVGKSSLLSVSTSARPKIDNYHFTTIEPNLGVVEVGDSTFVMADIAGIIEGAHEGAGLGFNFLKHIERTKVLIHVVDVAGSEGRDPKEDFDKIMDELGKYDQKILKKPMLVAANKIDLIDEDDEGYMEFRKYVEDKGYRVFPISAPINVGVKELMKAALEELSKVPEDEQASDFEEEFEFDDIPADSPDYREIYASKEGDKYVLTGKQLRKIFDSTNFTDDGSLRYLYKYIEKRGGIDMLKDLGIEDGDTVKVFDYEFEYIDEDM
ncbi:MAG: GTPase ObgE [Eubacteriales bacterium]|nr:GTPase ObgE [Eubacteriales bacterium]